MPFWRRVGWLLERKQKVSDLQEELAFHLEEETDARRDAGVTEAQARRAARLDLGNPVVIADDTRAAWGWTVWEQFAEDVRYALRTFRRSPGFAATAVVSLAVGIAAATGVFSIVNAALLNPFPFADINRIVRLDMNDKGKPRGLSVTARQLVALQHSEVFDGAFAWNTYDMTLTGEDFPETVRTQYFSANGLNASLRGSAPPRTSLRRGGRPGGRAGPAGRRAHLSVLAVTLWRAAGGTWADPPLEPRVLHTVIGRAATSILCH